MNQLYGRCWIELKSVCLLLEATINATAAVPMLCRLAPQGVIVSSLNLVAAGGGLIAGSVSDTLGRKRSIAAACLVFITGSIIKIAAQSFG